MQNAGLAALGLNWRYLAFEVAPEQLKPAIEGAKALRFVGLNLTVPHKLLAYDLVDALDESARQWGAVNTIRFEGLESGEWRPMRLFSEPPSQIRAHGFNTDADAIIQALQEDIGVDVRGKNVLLLGAGGAGRTAALRLAAEGVGKLFLVNRTEEKAKAVAKEIASRYPAVCVELAYPRTRVDLVLNATSLGLRETDPLPFEERRFSLEKATAVFDLVYRPAKTALMLAASERGCRTANGLGMLLYQGAKALEIWTGVPAPVGPMRAALAREVYGTR